MKATSARYAMASLAIAMVFSVTACAARNPAGPSIVPAVSSASFDLTGEVLGAGGVPLAGVDITLSNGDEERHAVTDADGKFRFAGLEGGDWTATLRYKNYEDRVISITVNSSLTLSFDMIPI